MRRQGGKTLKRSKMRQEKQPLIERQNIEREGIQ